MFIHSMFILQLNSEEITSYSVGFWVLIDEGIYKEQSQEIDGHSLLTYSNEDTISDMTLRADD